MDREQDICMLHDLTDLRIVECIQQRYKDGITCTRLGQSLISVNACNLQGPVTLAASDTITFAGHAVKSLISTEEDQSIILYGRSGSGKTRNAHAIVRSLFVNNDAGSLKDLVVAAQSVCNAFTLTSIPSNDQRSSALHVWSCRYSGAQLCGVEISVLLQDAELVLKASRGDCSTHVVRYLLSGLPPSKVEELGMQLPMCTEAIETDSRRFIDVDSSLKMLGFSEKERCGVWDVLCAVVLLTMETPSVEIVASLLHVGTEELEMVYRASDLPQELYTYLYKWILQRMNTILTKDCPSETVQLLVVDLVGHQTTAVGSFHQLLRGYVDELLLNVQWMRLYEWEQAQYAEEEIEWEHVEVPNRCGLLHDFNKVGGLLECVEEGALSSIITKITSLAATCGEICSSQKHQSPDLFTVVHYMGEQTYQLDESWVRINRSHPSHVASLLEGSTHPVVQEIAKIMHGPPDLMLGECVSSSCLSRRIRISLDILEEHITSSSPHFIYCLSPSEDSGDILQQVQHLQLVDIALIQSTGYPVHISIEEFVIRYGSAILCEAALPVNANTCTRILRCADLQQWCVGRTKVFLKPWHVGQLEEQLKQRVHSATTVQNAFRRHKTCKKSEKPIETPCFTNSRSLPEDRTSVLNEYMTVMPTARRKKRPSWARDKSVLRPSVHIHTPPFPPVASEPWLCRKLSRDLAEDALIKARDDCFLIRESEPLGCYTLSLRQRGVLKHFRIIKRECSGRYCLNGSSATFGSLSSLVYYYSHNCVTSSGELLINPCPIEDDTIPPALPPRRLLTIRKPQRSDSSGAKVKVAVPIRGKIRSQTCAQDMDASLAALQKELELEEKMVQAARRLANMPGTPKDKEQRGKVLIDAQARVFKLQQQYHMLQDRMKCNLTL